MGWITTKEGKHVLIANEGTSSPTGERPTGKAKFKLASTKPPKGFGMRRAEYKNANGDLVQVLHSRYSADMKTGSTLSGYSRVTHVAPGNKNRFGEPNLTDPTLEKTFKGDNHVEKTTKFVGKEFGIKHDASRLKEYKGK